MANNFKTIKIDDNNNIVINDGKLVLIDKNDAIAQELKHRFKTILGEWELNTGIGTDYLSNSGIFSPALDNVQRDIVIKSRIFDDTDIIEIYDYNAIQEDQTYTVTTKLKTVNNDDLDITFTTLK